MSSFSDIFPHSKIMSVLGDDIVYKRKNSSFIIKAEVEHDAQFVGNDGIVIENRIEIEFLRTAIPFIPDKGDKISYKNKIYFVESLIKKDDHYYRVVVKKS